MINVLIYIIISISTQMNSSSLLSHFGSRVDYVQIYSEKTSALISHGWSDQNTFWLNKDFQAQALHAQPFVLKEF